MYICIIVTYDVFYLPNLHDLINYLFYINNFFFCQFQKIIYKGTYPRYKQSYSNLYVYRSIVTENVSHMAAAVSHICSCTKCNNYQIVTGKFHVKKKLFTGSWLKQKITYCKTKGIIEFFVHCSVYNSYKIYKVIDCNLFTNGYGTYNMERGQWRHVTKWIINTHFL